MTSSLEFQIIEIPFKLYSSAVNKNQRCAKIIRNPKKYNLCKSHWLLSFEKKYLYYNYLVKLLFFRFVKHYELSTNEWRRRRHYALRLIKKVKFQAFWLGDSEISFDISQLNYTQN